MGFHRGGGARNDVSARLSVVIRERTSGKALWEGRAENTERGKSREAGAEIAAARMTKALFALFPGTSGATIRAK